MAVWRSCPASLFSAWPQSGSLSAFAHSQPEWTWMLCGTWNSQKKKACRHCVARKPQAQTVTENPSAPTAHSPQHWTNRWAPHTWRAPRAPFAVVMATSRKLPGAQFGAHQAVFQNQEVGDHTTCLVRCLSARRGCRDTRQTDCESKRSNLRTAPDWFTSGHVQSRSGKIDHQRETSKRSTHRSTFSSRGSVAKGIKAPARLTTLEEEFANSLCPGPVSPSELPSRCPALITHLLNLMAHKLPKFSINEKYSIKKRLPGVLTSVLSQQTGNLDGQRDSALDPQTRRRLNMEGNVSWHRFTSPRRTRHSGTNERPPSYTWINVATANV